jgi:prepilin-type processing-associated H-X9-DG protein
VIGNTLWKTALINGIPARAQQPPTFLCPSDSSQGRFCSRAALGGGAGGAGTNGWARGNYAVNAGPQWFYRSVNLNSVAELFGFNGRGPTSINKGDAIHRVPDGSSNTIWINEVRVGPVDTDPRGVWALGFPGSSVTAANAIGDCTTPNDLNAGSDDVKGCTSNVNIGMGCGSAGASAQAQARAKHSGGANAAFVDGHVTFVRNTISQQTWYLMLSADDGQVWTSN